MSETAELICPGGQTVEMCDAARTVIDAARRYLAERTEPFIDLGQRPNHLMFIAQGCVACRRTVHAVAEIDGSAATDEISTSFTTLTSLEK